MPFDVTLGIDGALKPSVRVPSVPVIERLPNVATPLLLVVAVVVPPSVPPPVAIVAVTTTPACATALFDASRSWTAGCVAKGTPLVADDDGCVVMLNAAGAPATEIVIVPDVAGVRLPDEKRSVNAPAVPLIDRFVNVAVPFVFVVAVAVPPSVPVPDAIVAVIVMPD